MGTVPESEVKYPWLENNYYEALADAHTQWAMSNFMEGPMERDMHELADGFDGGYTDKYGNHWSVEHMHRFITTEWEFIEYLSEHLFDILTEFANTKYESDNKVGDFGE